MRPALPLLLVLAGFWPSLLCQSTQADLQARLVGKPLFLRDGDTGDKLRYDAAGANRRASQPESFTVSGLDIQTVDLSRKHLVLSGRRIALRFAGGSPQREPLMHPGFGGKPEESRFRLEIDAPPTGDYRAPLDAMLATLPELVPTLPDFWQTYAQAHLLADSPPADGPMPRMRRPPTPPGVDRIGGAVSPPVVLKQPEPVFSEAARAMKISGNVLVYLQVDTDGKPMHLHIVRPVGLGLDEKAIEAVNGYVFRPARRDGNPIAVEMQVDVNFQVY